MALSSGRNTSKMGCPRILVHEARSSQAIRMQKFQFFSLPRPIQERFIESTRGNAVPKPLLYQSPPQNPWVLGLVVTASLLVAVTGIVASLGFGRLDHRWAVNPPWALLVYGGLLCVASVTLVAAVRNWNHAANVPFRRGLYVFPIGVIDARAATLQMHPLQELTELTTRGTRLRMRFSDGSTFDFRGVDPQRSGKIKVTLLDAQQQLGSAPGELSARERGLIDPLFDTGFKNPFSPHESMLPARIFWKKHWFALAMVAGAVTGAGLWQLRNQRSLERLYVRARSLNTPAAYRAYLARGGKNADVRDLLLPRAELREAQATGTVEAVERYLDANPHSKIESDVEGALREALLREFNAARGTGSLTALREFRKDDPHVALIKAEVDAAQAEQFKAALIHFQAMAKTTPELTALFEKLLGYAKLHGPKVEIRYRRRTPPSVQKADTAVQKSPYCNDPSVPPAQYFDADHFARREAKAALQLSKRFAEAFAKDVLSFELASPLDDDGSPVPSVAQPTLLITHRTELSSPFTSRKPPGVFVGVGLVFKAQMLIPGAPPSRGFESSTWSPPNIKRIEAEGWGPAEFYEATAEEGFEQFVNRYLSSIFRTPK